MTRRSHALALVFVALAAGCRAGVEKPAGEPPQAKTSRDQIVLSPEEQATGTIATEAATAVDLPDVLRVSGRITRADERTWRVGVRTDGLVRSVLVNLGDAVRKDQLLARYHADEVREERAKHRTAVSERQRLEAAAALAARNYDRMTSLLELKAASVQQVDQARQDRVAADAAARNAQVEVERTVDVLEDDLRVPVDPIPGNEEADQVPIIAPAAGYVLEKNVTPGRTIAPGQDAFVISDLSLVWMMASVRQDRLGQLRVGQRAAVILPGRDGERFVGTVANIGQELDPTTRAVPVRIVLNNPGQHLRPEMLATADIPVAGTTSVLTVSSDAVQQVGGQDVVFVRTAPDRFVMRPVRVGPTANGRTPVLEGLTSGEQTVVRGSFVLKSHLLRSTMEGN